MSQVARLNLSDAVSIVNASQVIKLLVKKGVTLESLKTNPIVRFTRRDLYALTPFDEQPITRKVAQETIQLLLENNRHLTSLFKVAQLKKELLGNLYDVQYFKDPPDHKFLPTDYPY